MNNKCWHYKSTKETQYQLKDKGELPVAWRGERVSGAKREKFEGSFAHRLKSKEEEEALKCFFQTRVCGCNWLGRRANGEGKEQRRDEGRPILPLPLSQFQLHDRELTPELNIKITRAFSSMKLCRGYFRLVISDPTRPDNPTWSWPEIRARVDWLW